MSQQSSQSSQSTTSQEQQHIDDEELLEELGKYGEKNLPTIPQPGQRITKKSHILTEQNRDIYLKKLNHYRAREKAEQNPSKYLKSNQLGDMTTSSSQSVSMSSKAKRRSSARFDLKSNRYYENNDNYVDYDDEDDDDNEQEQQDDVVEIASPHNSNESSAYEYVKVSNANTSPMSNTTYYQRSNSSNPYNDRTEADADVDDHYESAYQHTTALNTLPPATISSTKRPLQRNYSDYVPSSMPIMNSTTCQPMSSNYEAMSPRDLSKFSDVFPT
jgi:hypothetical protein